jgi:mono/diheme cytochrome c family protein
MAAWRFMVPAHARDTTNPVPASADVLKEARDHWADHCALCHDNDGSGDTSVGRRVYPPVPDVRTPQVQRLTDGELFYAIEHGVPWTAMPGWTTGTAAGEEQSWALVRFIRHLPALTTDELKEMEAINPRTPTSPQEQRDIDEFLKGPLPGKPGRGGGG